MDTEFDFLSYLDFGNGPNQLPVDELSFASSNSDFSTSPFASPHNNVHSDFSGDNHRSISSSPPASSGLSLGFKSASRAPAIAVNDGFSFAGYNINPNLPSSYGHSNGSSNGYNSPPFDTSIYYNLPMQHSQVVVSKPVEISQYPVDADSFQSQNNLSAQWQQLLLQQGQLQTQMQQKPFAYHANNHYNPSSGVASSPSMSSFSNAESPVHSDVLSERIPSNFTTSHQPEIASSYQTMSSVLSQPILQSSQPAFRPILNLPAAPQQQRQQPQIQRQQSQHQQEYLPTQRPQQPAHQPVSDEYDVDSSAFPPVIKKATLKRRYQQNKQESVDPVPFLLQAPILDANTSIGTAGDETDKSNKNPGGHNAVEQKYRRGINDSLIMLREIVPALQHLRAAPGSIPSKRKMSQFSLAAAATPAAPSGIVDGVMAPKKLSKQLILVTATDYIRYLLNRREELEGELEMLKTTLDDCLDDSSIVTNLFEQRWAPERAKILEEREQLQQERVSTKEGGKKRAKLESGATGSAGSKKSRGKKDDSDSDEDDSDEDDDEDLATASSSAVPVKGQVRARTNLKNPTRTSAGTAPASGMVYSHSQQQEPGPPKALMSVFAGVSFAGGAGYDLLYGASSNNAAAAGPSESVNPARVWSHGLVRRTNPSLPSALGTASFKLNALQTFFLERPALLSGLVMLIISCLSSYVLLYLLPSLYSSLTKSNAIAKRDRARAILLDAAKHSANSSRPLERQALATLAGCPTSVNVQVLRFPALAISAVRIWVFGKQTASATDAAALETAASALRLLEMDMASVSSNYISFLSSFLHVFALAGSSKWPSTQTSVALTVKAEGTLALAAVSLFGRRAQSAASQIWSSAQARLKKHDAPEIKTWLPLAMSVPLIEAINIPLQSTMPLFHIAEHRCQAILLKAWRDLFVHVIRSTLVDKEVYTAASSSTCPALASKRSTQNQSARSDQVDEVLAAMPPSSPLHTLALVCKGVEAIGNNQVAQAMQIALQLPSHLPELASVRAFKALVSGTATCDIPIDINGDLDSVAYMTVTWLSIRQAATALSTIEAQESCIDEEIQATTIQLRKLLNADVFTSDGLDESFIDAQERCVEGLVGIGRKAAGLDSLSDSGCEL